MTILFINLASLLKQLTPCENVVSASMKIDNCLEILDQERQFELYLDPLLDENQVIGIVWNTQLIKEERPDLTQDQAWDVLRACQTEFEEVTDSTRRTIHLMANSLFPEPKGKVGVEMQLSRLQHRLDNLHHEGSIGTDGYDFITELVNTLKSQIESQ